MKVEKKAGGVIGVLCRVEHISQFEEAFGMPFGVDLHAADIDAMLGIDNSLRQIGKGRLASSKNNPSPRSFRVQAQGMKSPVTVFRPDSTRVMLCRSPFGIPCRASARLASTRHMFSKDVSVLPACATAFIG